MKSTKTGDQSGGLEWRDGGSTPTRSGSERLGPEGRNAQDPDSHTSKEVAESTDSKNVPGAFEQPDKTEV